MQYYLFQSIVLQFIRTLNFSTEWLVDPVSPV